MKKLCGVLWIGVFVLSLLLPVSAWASVADVELLIMDPDPKGANVRAAPDNGKIIRAIPLNPPNRAFRKVRVTEQKGRWFAVELADGTKGWMHDSTLGSVSRKNAVLKAEPRREAPDTAKVPDGKYLSLSAVQGNWAKVTYTDEKKAKHTGWLAQAQLETDIKKIPVFPAPKPEAVRASGNLNPQVMSNAGDGKSGNVDFSALAGSLIPLINNERRAVGAAELRMDKNLMKAAARRASELTKKYSHQRPDGREWHTVMEEFGLDPVASAENIAYRRDDSALEMNKQFMNSPGHKKNMLNAEYTRAGVGVLRDGNKYYWVELFAGEECAAKR
jgi:uncharacterized protein YkwD